MGFKNVVGSAVQAQKDMNQRGKDQRAAAVEALPDPQYHMEVNKNSMNMNHQTQRLNHLWAQGWKLHTALEQNGNTVFVFERRAPIVPL